MSRVGVAMRGRSAKDIYEDTPEQPKHTVKVLHLEPETRLGIDELCRHVQARVDGLPVLRRQLRRSPPAHPWWEELPGLDVHAHIELRAVAPGPDARNRAIAAELTDRLPTDRPLWRLRLLDAPDGQSLVLSASHALLDGFVAARVLEALFGPDPQPWPSEERPLPSPPVELFALVAATPRLLVRALASAIGKARSPAARAAARPFSGPAGPWNELLLTADRGYAEATVECAAFDTVMAASRASFTEIAVAVVGGALRTVLAAERPSGELLAVVPASSRRDDDPITAANLLTYMFITTGADVAEPRERLRTVVASARAARARVAAGDPRLFADAWDLWPLLRASHQLSRRITHRWVGRPPAAVVVSTVRGPRVPLSVAGVPIRSVVSGGVITDDQGLNVTVWSSARFVTFGVTGRPDLVDVGLIATALARAVEDLRAGG